MPNKMTKFEFDAVMKCPNYMPMGGCGANCPLRENYQCEFDFQAFKDYIKEHLEEKNDKRNE